MDELRKEVWREAKQEKKNQPKRKRGRPRKGEEGKETAKHGKRYKYALGKNPEMVRLRMCNIEVLSRSSI